MKREGMKAYMQVVRAYKKIKRAERKNAKQRKSLKSRLGNLKQYLKEKSSLYAPRTGIIVHNAKIGSIITKNSPIYSLEKNDPLYAHVKIPEEEYIQMKAEYTTLPGKVARFQGRTFSGHVKDIKKKNGFFHIVFALNNKQGELRSGDTITFEYDKGFKSLEIPFNAVMKRDNQYYVMVEEKGKVFKKVITIEKQLKNTFIIKGNELKGCKIVQNKKVLETLKDGVTIKVRKNNGGK